MLAMSAQLDPVCEHVVADMRTLSLGRRFDVVLAHEAIDYITVADLDRVGEGAWGPPPSRRRTWVQALAGYEFAVQVAQEETLEDRPPRR
jgi:hypothetical protein